MAVFGAERALSDKAILEKKARGWDAPGGRFSELFYVAAICREIATMEQLSQGARRASGVVLPYRGIANGGAADKRAAASPEGARRRLTAWRPPGDRRAPQRGVIARSPRAER